MDSRASSLLMAGSFVIFYVPILTRLHLADALINTPYTSLKADFSVRNRGITLLRLLSSSKDRSIKLVVLMDLLCTTGNFRWYKRASRSSLKAFTKRDIGLCAGI
jgi:hypothetical protein